METHSLICIPLLTFLSDDVDYLGAAGKRENWIGYYFLLYRGLVCIQLQKIRELSCQLDNAYHGGLTVQSVPTID